MSEVKLEGQKIYQNSWSLGISLESCWVANFLSIPNFDLWYFCSLLTYKSVQYLIWKIWLISTWRMKAKVMVWLLTWFIFAQSTLNSYHTEAFVKTEVGCTVLKMLRFNWKRSRLNSLRQVRTRIKRKWIYESILTFSHHSLFKTSRDERSTHGECSKSSQTRRTEHSRLARGFRVALVSVKLQKKVSIISCKNLYFESMG